MAGDGGSCSGVRGKGCSVGTRPAAESRVRGGAQRIGSVSSRGSSLTPERSGMGTVTADDGRCSLCACARGVLPLRPCLSVFRLGHSQLTP